MKYYYDMHIHSALSPCSDNDMTPNNIINMSYIKGLDIVSITDHNSIDNYPAIAKLAKKKSIYTIPGIEVTSKEEVHLLCYFPNYKLGKRFADLIFKALPKIKNNPKIFGNQLIMDEEDNIVREEEYLLNNACSYGIEDIYKITCENNGIVIPAHVNRISNGIIGVLGFIPSNLKFRFIEVDNNIKAELINILKKNYKIMRNSDAHRLTEINERENYFCIDNTNKIFKFLKG